MKMTYNPNMTAGSSALALQLPMDENFAKQQEFFDLCKDDASMFIKSEAEFIAFLGERERNARWVDDVSVRGLRVLLLDEVIFLDVGKLRDTIVADTSKNTGLVLQGGSIAQTAIRTCAIPTLLDRAKISGTALSKVATSVLRDIINECLKVAATNANAKIRIADGKISSVMSNSYVALPMPDIFTMVSKKIRRRFTTAEFLGGSWDHTYTIGEWKLSGERGLIKKYAEKLDAHGVDYDKVQPAIRVSSSDVGKSAVNIVPKLIYGKDQLLLPIGGSIGVEHEGKSTMENVEENMDGVYSLYNERLQKLANLLEVEINHPYDCMGGILKKMQVPMKYANPALESFGAGFGEYDGCTAHDIFFGLGELIMQLQIDGIKGSQVLKYEEQISKVLSWNFKDFDIKGGAKR